MRDVAIKVSNVRIIYKGLKKMSIKKNLMHGKKVKKDFVAIDNVSFEVKKGNILGIVGKNGSGKSTLLRAIAGVFALDKGKIDLYGNTVSLLSIGVGFLPKLSGYENIYLSGMLLGFDKKQIDEKIDEIIEFSELQDFIYEPVSKYSSGMYSKLAFSITAILETDIILIDEVLSVGDIAFKKKSYNKMKELIGNEDRTVVIVSHSISTLQDLCDEVIWLKDGKVHMQGTPKEVLSKYEDASKEGEI